MNKFQNHKKGWFEYEQSPTPTYSSFFWRAMYYLLTKNVKLFKIIFFWK